MVKTVRALITKEMAAKMLANNPSNRPIGKSHVARLAAAMSRGEMEFNGSTIKVSETGKLLDGQHRLTACVESGCSFESLIVYGLPDQCFGTIDQTSRPRKISDVLAIDYGQSMKNVSAAVSLLYRFREFGGLSSYNNKALEGFTVAVARELLEKHPGIVDAVSKSNSVSIWRNAYCSCLFHLFGMADPRLADEFIDVMRNGSSMTKRPFNIFRESLIRLRTASGTPDHVPASARAIKAFNAELTGGRVSVLVWRSTEEFPVIAGLDYSSI